MAPAGRGKSALPVHWMESLRDHPQFAGDGWRPRVRSSAGVIVGRGARPSSIMAKRPEVNVSAGDHLAADGRRVSSGPVSVDRVPRGAELKALQRNEEIGLRDDVCALAMGRTLGYEMLGPRHSSSIRASSCACF
jgi:hypothetical protein